MLKIFCTLFFALFLTSAYSQNNIFFHIGPAFPLSDFGDDDDKNDNARGAKLGIDCGLKYIYKVNDVGLGLFGQVDFIYNSLTNRFKDEIDDYFLRNYDKLRSTNKCNFSKKGKKAFEGFFPFDQVVQSLDCLCQKITTNSA